MTVSKPQNQTNKQEKKKRKHFLYLSVARVNKRK